MTTNEELEEKVDTPQEEVEEVVEKVETEGDTEVEAQVVEEVEVDEVELLKAALQDQENKRLRALADYDNFKRRAALDKEALRKYQSQSVLTSLIPVLDSFKHALSVEPQSEEAISMKEGMEMIYRSLADALKSEGLVEIEAIDQPFDPNFHQAIMMGSDEDKANGVVLEEMQKGYMLKDRVLRPSMVKVNE